MELNCANDTCWYASCWDATKFPHAVVVRMPRFIPVPTEVTNPLSIVRSKRDFGITAAIVSAITIAAAGATAAAVSLSTSVQTATALNNLSANVASALDMQTSVNAHLKGGLMIVNQRVDLVQEQLDVLWQLAQIGCMWRMPGLCVTPVQYHNMSEAANLSRELSMYLTSNWTGRFDHLVRQLRVAIAHVNSTRVDIVFAQGISDWIASAVSILKEWAGMGSMIALLALAVFLGFWWLCKLRRQRQNDNIMLMQAFAALEAGYSPAVWLANLQ